MNQTTYYIGIGILWAICAILVFGTFIREDNRFSETVFFDTKISTLLIVFLSVGLSPFNLGIIFLIDLGESSGWDQVDTVLPTFEWQHSAVHRMERFLTED